MFSFDRRELWKYLALLAAPFTGLRSAVPPPKLLKPLAPLAPPLLPEACPLEACPLHDFACSYLLDDPEEVIRRQILAKRAVAAEWDKRAHGIDTITQSAMDALVRSDAFNVPPGRLQRLFTPRYLFDCDGSYDAEMAMKVRPYRWLDMDGAKCPLRRPAVIASSLPCARLPAYGDYRDAAAEPVCLGDEIFLAMDDLAEGCRYQCPASDGWRVTPATLFIKREAYLVEFFLYVNCVTEHATTPGRLTLASGVALHDSPSSKENA